MQYLQIGQASEAIAAQLDVSAPKSKGFKSSGVKKLAVDVPVADQTAPAVRTLDSFQKTVTGSAVSSTKCSACLLLCAQKLCSILQVAQLVTDVLKGMPKSIVAQLTVVFADESSTEAAQKAQKQAKQKYKAIYLGDAFVEGISGWLMVVGPTADQVCFHNAPQCLYDKQFVLT